MSCLSFYDRGLKLNSLVSVSNAADQVLLVYRRAGEQNLSLGVGLKFLRWLEGQEIYPSKRMVDIYLRMGEEGEIKDYLKTIKKYRNFSIDFSRDEKLNLLGEKIKINNVLNRYNDLEKEMLDCIKESSYFSNEERSDLDEIGERLSSWLIRQERSGKSSRLIEISLAKKSYKLIDIYRNKEQRPSDNQISENRKIRKIMLESGNSKSPSDAIKNGFLGGCSKFCVSLISS